MSLDDCRPCPYGSYCDEGAGVAACPAGHYCPESTNSSTEYPCPAGTYRETTGAKSEQDCKPCGVGHYCLEGSIHSTLCQTGHYNDFSSTAAACQRCPAGFECKESGTVHPVPCERGYYSSVENTTTIYGYWGRCIPCKPGTYCPEKGTSNETMIVDQVCDAGLLCRRCTITNCASW